MRGIQVLPVRSARERRVFLTFPWRVYRGDPLWVPPLLPERRRRIDPLRSAFFQHGQAELFVAWRDGRPVGTICAGEDRHANDSRETRECVFGFFECLEDYEAAAALLDRAAGWARERSLDTLFGPFNLDYEDSYGVLVEGRDRPPVLLCGHCPPYYQHFLERYGFAKTRGDAVAFAVDLQNLSPEFRKLSRLADRIRHRGWIKVRGADMAHWDREVDRLVALLNGALAHLPDHVPWTRERAEQLVGPFRRIADPELVLFATIEGRTVGWFPGIPNLNEHFRKVGGLRYPWQYLKLLWLMRRRTECLTVKSVLVLPEYWGSGVAALMFDELARRAVARGYRWADLSLTAEDNPHTPVLAQRLGARLYKRYRVYRRRID